jgi:membrane protease YdiL (CAAX protease family)
MAPDFHGMWDSVFKRNASLAVWLSRMLTLTKMFFTFAILAVVLSYVWFFEPQLPSSAVAAPVVIVLGLGAVNAARTREWGFRREAFGRALRAAALFTAPMIGIIVAAGAAAGTLHTRRDFLDNLLALVLWGGGQQWILQTVLLREAQHATSRRAGVFVAAALFAALHLPNPFLTTMTLIGAVGWCAIYDRHPNIIPLALSHAIATLAILYAFDDAMTGRLRVGVAYLMLNR